MGLSSFNRSRERIKKEEAKLKAKKEEAKLKAKKEAATKREAIIKKTRNG